MSEMKDGCVAPAKGPILPESADESAASKVKSQEKEIKMVAKVGKEAPDFEANQ